MVGMRVRQEDGWPRPFLVRPPSFNRMVLSQDRYCTRARLATCKLSPDATGISQERASTSRFVGHPTHCIRLRRAPKELGKQACVEIAIGVLHKLGRFSMKSMDDLFHNALQDMYYAEK